MAYLAAPPLYFFLFVYIPVVSSEHFALQALGICRSCYEILQSERKKKKPASSSCSKCLKTCSKYSKLLSYCDHSCAPQPISDIDVTSNSVCNPQMPGQVCVLEEVVVKMLLSSIKAVVCLLVKVKGDPHMVLHSLYTTEIT